MRTCPLIFAAMAIAVSGFATGCLAPVAIAGAAAYGGYEYSNGEMQYAVHANVDRVNRAVRAVIKERAWEIREQATDATTGFYRCMTQDNTQVTIDVRRRSGDFTRVAVHYGVFGDEAESKKVIDQVKARL